MPTENRSYSFWVGHFFFRRLFWLSCTFSIVTHLNRMYTKCDSIGGPISKFTIPTVFTIQCVIVCTNTFDGQPNHWTVSGFCFRKINHFFNNWTMKCLFPCTKISLKCRWFFFSRLLSLVSSFHLSFFFSTAFLSSCLYSFIISVSIYALPLEVNLVIIVSKCVQRTRILLYWFGTLPIGFLYQCVITNFILIVWTEYNSIDWARLLYKQHYNSRLCFWMKHTHTEIERMF